MNTHTQAWVSENGVLDALHRCSNASTHVKTCVLNALNALSRTSASAQILRSQHTDELLFTFMQDKMPADLNSEQRDKYKASTAVAAMALANVRAAFGDEKTAVGTEKRAVGKDKTAVAANANDKTAVGNVVTLDKRVATTILQICNAAVDGVAFAGTKYNVAGALYALPALLKCKQNVDTMVEK
jgi:hypothetical protein